LQLPRMNAKAGRPEDALKGERPAYSGTTRDFIPFKVYDRYRLCPGVTFPGPAIIEERESTVIVGEDASVRVDEYGFLWIEM
ncbi:MAG: hydantoinase/oxoprolinase family protein, partial [Deltaproteobacteria bacterium]|nr:hydantoinase/oxoprolinase family protein [Deltaproteobacteria bacterium]